MAPPAMRKLLLLLSFLFAGAILDMPVVAAQETTEIRLTLLSQTPWNSSYEEDGRELVIRFRAENTGAEPLDELSIGVSLFGRLISRTALEESLVADPGFPLAAATYPREGAIVPNEPREFEVAFSLESGIDPDHSGVYPVKIDLRSGVTSLAAIRTPVVFLVRPPETPLGVSWTFVLDHPIEFGPDGVFTSTSLEARLARGGILRSQIRSLRALATRPPQPAVDVAVSPMLLRQLAMMRDGYEVMVAGQVRRVRAGEGGALLADRALEQLQAIAAAPNVGVSALPFSGPELPSLLAGGLARDLTAQLARGREVVSALLETIPSSRVLRPPGGAIDDATIRELAAAGVSTVIVEPTTVEMEPQPQGFAGLPTATVGDDGGIRAIVPDAAVAALLESSEAPSDPVHAAQVVVGALASIWQEQPGLLRGLALVVPEDATLPGRFYVPFTRAIASAPWLAPMHAEDLTTAIEPGEQSVLTPMSPQEFELTYVGELRQARRRISALRDILAGDSDQPERLDATLLLAESRQFLSDQVEGMAFIGDVHEAVSAVFRSVTIDTVDKFTLTSSTGSGIPVTVRNGANIALRLRVQLASPFLLGTPPEQELRLAPSEERTVTFHVNARSAGSFEATLRVLAPGGRPIGKRVEITIRSTVLNRIALLITIGAALVLLGLWARRFIPRRTS
jgi:Family of unknown function (DUF6049)